MVKVWQGKCVVRTVSLPRDLDDALVMLAKRQNKPISRIVRALVEQHLKETGELPNVMNVTKKQRRNYLISEN